MPTHVAESRRRVIANRGETDRTKQAPREQTNMRAIIAKYRKTGEIDLPGVSNAIYGDFSDVTSYHEMYTKVIDAQEGFLSLPASLRTHLKNDPAELLDVVTDPARRAEALELGLVNPTEEEEKEQRERERQTQFEKTPEGDQAVIPGTREEGVPAPPARAEEASSDT